MEDAYQDQRSDKLSRICKFLLIIHQEFQSYSKTSQWTQRKEGMELDRRSSKSIWRT